jgi:hypothetical protein
MEKWKKIWIKVNATNKNIKFEKIIYASRCIEVQKNQNENYNSAKPLIFI